MELMITTDEQLRAIIPNVMATIEGETTMFEKLLPFIEQQNSWVETNIIGDIQLENNLIPLLQRIIALRSFANAIPTLDLVLSPTGFAVVSTSELAPASKERVERLLQTVRAEADASIDMLFVELQKIECWRNSYPGMIFSRSLIKYPGKYKDWFSKGDIVDNFSAVQSLAHNFEYIVASKYFGRKLIDLLISYPYDNSMPDELKAECAMLYPMVASAEDHWIKTNLVKNKDGHFVIPNIWHLITPSLSLIKSLPIISNDYFISPVDTPVDVNDKRGAYYF